MSHKLPAAVVFAIVGAVASVCGVATPLALRAQVMPPPPPAAPAMSGHASADSAQAIVNFVTTVNRDELAAAKLAVMRATRSEVRSYAQHVIDAHSKAMTEWEAKVGALSLTIPDSAKAATKSPQAMAGSAAMANGISEVRDTTTALRGGMGAAAIHSANVAALAELQKANGDAFDKMYVAAQVKGHEATLREINEHPTTYTQLQTLYTQFRGTVEQHLTAARKLVP